MDSLQEQILVLNSKVDALHQVIERLSEKVTNVFSDLKLNMGSENHHRHQSDSGFGRYSHHIRSSYDAVMEHKDVIADTSYPDSDTHSGERVLAPEVQIQRLTAQLTAAYNRMAALEEQLLAQRMH